MRPNDARIGACQEIARYLQRRTVHANIGQVKTFQAVPR